MGAEMKVIFVTLYCAHCGKKLGVIPIWLPIRYEDVPDETIQLKTPIACPGTGAPQHRPRKLQQATINRENKDGTAAA